MQACGAAANANSPHLASLRDILSGVVRILIVHQYCLGKNQSGATKIYELAEAFARAGHKVTVVSGTANVFTGRVPSQYRHRLLTREHTGGIDFIRTYTWASSKKTLVRRLLNHVSFMCSSLWGAAAAGPADVVFTTSPPLLVGFSGYLFSRLRRAPFVFDVRDLWPESAVEMGVLKNRFVIWTAGRIARFFYRRASTVVAIADGMIPHLEKAGVPRDKMVAIPNGVDTDVFGSPVKENEVRREWGLSGKFVVMYAGAHVLSQSLETLVEAARILSPDPRIQFVLVGEGSEKARIQHMVASNGLENVHFKDAVGKGRMPPILAAADVFVAHLRNVPLFEGALPNKLIEYLGAGRPVVVGIGGDARRLVEAAGGGIYVEPEDPEAMATAVRKLADGPELCRTMGESAHTYMAANYSRELQAKRYEDVLMKAAGGDVVRAPRTIGRRAGLAVKRVADVLMSLVLLVTLLPLLVALGVAVSLDSPGAPFFLQERVGRNRRLFKVIKFRTMKVGAVNEGLGFHTADDDPRITRLGRFLRRWSLDELPQLLNVLKGDMSIVGPRPTLKYQVDEYTPHQLRRLEMRPGVTGHAQVSGRNILTWPERIELDIWYIDHWSLWLDLKTLARTLKVWIAREGIYTQ